MAKAKSPALWGGLHEGDLVVVDTAPLIYILEDHPNFAPWFQGLFEAADRGGLQVALSTITVAELLVGPFRERRDALAKRYEKALGSFEIVSVSTEIAVTAARLRASTGLRLPDAVLAATALEIGAVALVTHGRDFSKLSGLKVLPGQEDEFHGFFASANSSEPDPAINASTVNPLR